MKKKPVRKVTPVSFAPRRPANDKAVFVNIVCKDEADNTWHFSAACFCFDLEPGEPEEHESVRMEKENSAPLPTPKQLFKADVLIEGEPHDFGCAAIRANLLDQGKRRWRHSCNCSMRTFRGSL